MDATSKIAVTWLEAGLLALVVAGGLGIWLGVEKLVDNRASATEPREEPFQLGHGVPAREAELALAKDQIAALQAKWIEQRLELARETASAESLRETFPQLQPWLTANPPPLQLEMAQAWAQTWLDLETSRRLTAQLEVDLAALIDQKAEMTLALASSQPASKDFIRTEARLAACRNQLEATQKKLAEARLEPPRLRARLEAMTNAWPELQMLSPAAPGLVTLPTEVVQSVASAAARRRSAELLIDALHGELQARQTEVTNRMDALLQAQRAASKALKNAKERWTAEKRWNTLGLSCLWLAVSLLALLIISTIVIKASAAHFKRSVAFGGALAVLAVLYAYQMAQVPGAAAVALVLMLVLAAIGSGRRVPATPPAQAPDATPVPKGAP